MLEIVAAPIVAALALFGYVVVSDPQAVYVENVTTPAAMAADGYTGAVMEARLLDAARRMEAEARSFPAARRLAADADKTALRLLAENVGAVPAVRAAQKMTGRLGVAASGEVVRKGDGHELLLRVTTADGVERLAAVSAPAGDVDGLIENGAAALLTIADPYVSAARRFKSDHAAGTGYAAVAGLLQETEREGRAYDPRWTANLAGVAAFADRRLDEAVGHFERALALDPAFAPALVNRGVALASIGLHRDAVENYRQALALPQGGEFGPSHAAAYASWGVSLAALRQPDAARQAFEYAVGVSPDYVDGYFKWAQSMQALGRTTEAEAALRRRPDPSVSRPPLYPEYLVGPIGLDAYVVVGFGADKPNQR